MTVYLYLPKHIHSLQAINLNGFVQILSAICKGISHYIYFYTCIRQGLLRREILGMGHGALQHENVFPTNGNITNVFKIRRDQTGEIKRKLKIKKKTKAQR